MTNALELNNVTKHYKNFTLDNISFSVPTGSIMGFIGENGAGKSTTIKLILDEIKRDTGEIFLLGEEASSSNKDLREHIGVVLDECCFPEVLNLKNINHILKSIYCTWDEDLFFSYAKRFSLPQDKKVKDYSRGMKMKLSIAVALSHDSKLLLLDEATSGLDSLIRDEILEIFFEFIQDETHSILISSHIVSDLEKVCDYITFIHEGKIVFSEEKDKLLYEYGIVKCTEKEFQAIDKSAIKGYRKNQFGMEALVKKSFVSKQYVMDKVSIEDIMLFIGKGCLQ